MSPTTIGRAVGALTLLAFIFYLGGGELVASATGTTDILSGAAEHPTRLAAGTLLMLVNSVIVIGIGVLMFPILRPLHEITAHAYLAARVVEAVLLAVGVLLLLTLIPLAEAHGSAGGEGGVLPSLAEVVRAGNDDARYLAMIGLGLGGALFCLALFRSRLVPRALAALGMVGYPMMAAGEALAVLGYDLGGLHYAPGAVFEVAFGVLLLVRGFPDVASVATSPADEVTDLSLERRPS